MGDILLETKDISMAFGGLKVINNLNIQIRKNELVGLIGPNGAGKTTIFNILTGVYTPTEGEYIFNNKKINNVKTYKLAQNGLARTFQNIRLFNYLSVIDNVKIAYNSQMKYKVLSGAFRTKNYWVEEKVIKDKAMELLSIFELEKFAEYKAGSLPYGEQRKLEIARALATNPKLLLLDEPAAGMNPKETEELMKTIKFIREKFNISVLLIEHDMKLVLGTCERLIALDRGRVIAEGEPLKVVNSKEVITAYLGNDEED